MQYQDFPKHPVVKDLTANAGDTGFSPSPGRSHMRGAIKPTHHNYWAHCALGLWATTAEAGSLEAPQQEKQQQQEAHN